MTIQDIKSIQKRLLNLELKSECCHCDVIPTTSGAPTDPPSENVNIVVDPETLIIYIWNGSEWLPFSSSSNVIEQIGIAIKPGSPIVAGYAERHRIPFNGTIVGWTILETSATPITGDIVVDVKVGTYSDYDTTPIFSSIAGTEKPTISNNVKGQDTALTTWTTSVVAGDLIEYVVDSATDVENVVLFIDILRT